MLVLACPMDWRHNPETAKEQRFQDLRELIEHPDWEIRDETDLAYEVRLTDRQVIVYLTQVIAVAKRISSIRSGE
jgi:hypothetical protein